MNASPRRCETCAHFEDGIVGACDAPAPAAFDEFDRGFVLPDDGEHCVVWKKRDPADMKNAADARG